MKCTANPKSVTLSQGQRTKGSLNTDYLASQYLLTLEFTK